MGKHKENHKTSNQCKQFHNKRSRKIPIYPSRRRLHTRTKQDNINQICIRKRWRNRKQWNTNNKKFKTNI